MKNDSENSLCPIIVALDVDTKIDALKWVKKLGKHIDIFKIGLQLFSKEGPSVIKAITAEGKRVFVDLKLHDIPNTVAGAIRSLASNGVEFITLHAMGGEEMMRAAVNALKECHVQNPLISTRLLAVTVLTSLDDSDLRQMGVDHSISGQVLSLARLARSTGVDGVVASPQEVRLLRAEHGRDLVLVTPGIRLADDGAHDQKRTMTPVQAMEEGSDFLVMGRTLLDSKEPLKRLQEILAGLPATKE